MEKEFKVNDEVYVKTKVNHIHISDEMAVVNMKHGSNPWVNFSDLKHAEPEFIPREMMVWNKDGDIAQKRFISGIFDGWYMYKEEWGGYYSYRNAKEMPQELENGKVYQLGDIIAYKKDKRAGFGFDKNGFFSTEELISFNGDWQPYHIEDFKKLLIAEAEKRGFKSKTWIDRKELGFEKKYYRILRIQSDVEFSFNESGVSIFANGFLIFKNGTWAKIID